MTICPVTLDYLELVASRFGGGVYLVELYENGRFLKGGRWIEKIKNAATTPPVAPPVAPIAAPASDPLRAAADSLLIRSLERLVDAQPVGATAPAQPAAPAAPAPDPLRAAADSLFVRSLERMVDNPGASAPVPVQSQTWVGDVASLVSALSPLVAPVTSALGTVLVANIMKNAQAANNAPATQAANTTGADASSTARAPLSLVKNEQATASAGVDEKTDLQIVIEDALTDMATNQPTDKAVEDFVEIAAGGEAVGVLEMFESSSAEMLSVLLADNADKATICANPGYLRWWDEVKAEVKKRLAQKENS
jgi:hypothetical protein